MPKSIVSAKKRARGRPRVDATPVNTRFPPDELNALDEWIEGQKDQISRPEAVRQLVQIALSTSVLPPKTAAKRAWRKKAVERWAERIADIGWRSRLDNLLRAAVRGSTQREMFGGLPMQGPRGEDYVKSEAWELFGIKWKP